MKDEEKTKQQLIEELVELRQRIAAFEVLESERLQMDSILQESEQKYRELVALSPDSIVVLQDGVCKSVNRAFSQCFGYSQKDIDNGLKLLELAQEPDEASVCQRHTDRLSGKELPSTYRIDLVAKNGTLIPCEKSSTRIDYQNRPADLVIIRDLRERLQAEEALRESDSRFRQLTENIREVFYLSNLRTPQMLYISPGYEAIWGRSRQSLYADPISFLIAIHPADRDRVMMALDKQLRGEATEEVYQIVHPNGSIRWILDRAFPIRDEGGEVYRVAGIAEDITKLKQIENELRASNQALQESERKNRAMLQAIPDLMFLVRSDGTFVDFHASSDTDLYLPPAQFMGKTVNAVMPPTLAPQLMQCIQQAAQTGEMPHFEFQLTLDEKCVDYEARFVGCGDDHTLTIVRNITDRKQAEQRLQQTNDLLEQTLAELQETQQQVIQQERLRALGQMASGIAHDFNNALTPILGFSDLLLRFPENLDDRAQTTEYLQLIHTTAKETANVVKRLQEFYKWRQEDTPFQPVNLNQLIKQTISLTRPKWKDEGMAKGATIGINTELGDVPSVKGNAAELRGALTNLIFNATDAIESDGIITIRTDSDGEGVVLEVEDTGSGMTDAMKEHCFDPFFTTQLGRGKGLGLSTVVGTIRRHDGKISVKSQLAVGTTFTIRLPISSEPPTVNGAPHPAVGSRHLHVLVVDDEQPIRQLIETYLVDDGHTVETAKDGIEGLEKFRAGRFDLVILDRAMPYMNGDQLAIAIKQITPAKPVIMLTGFGDLMPASDGPPTGIDTLLSKPVTWDTLREALAKNLLL
jgi:PAS domain S-box-containing protein